MIGLRNPADRKEVGVALLARIEEQMRRHVQDWRDNRHRWPRAADYSKREFRSLHALRRQARFDADWSPVTFMRADLNRELAAGDHFAYPGAAR